MAQTALSSVLSKLYTYEALAALLRHNDPRPMNVADLGRRMGPSQQVTASSMADHLKAHGLITISKVPGEKRPEVYDLRLTPTGELLARGLIALEQTAEEALGDGMK